MSKKKVQLKLYVWTGVLCDYTCGMMFAIAESEKQAKQILLQECGYIPTEDLEKTPQVFDLTQPVGFYCWGGG